MIRAAIASAMFALTIPVTGLANGSSLPEMPGWQTEADNCAWQWCEGGGIGLWAETCLFSDATWQVDWDEDLAAFVTRKDDSVIGIAVQPLPLSSGASIASLSATLVEAGSLDANAPCIWQTVALRPAPRTMAYYVLTPIDPAALSPTLSGDIPEPACGPYGASSTVCGIS